MNINIDFNKMAEGAKTFSGYVINGCKVIIPIIGLAYLGKFEKKNGYDDVWYINERIRDFESEIGYGDAISAIASSSTASCYKDDMVKYVKKDGDSQYYKGVIGIACSDMAACYKADAIKNMV